jgi:ribosomal protein S18 acetylase RimI-like enzyme
MTPAEYAALVEPTFGEFVAELVRGGHIRADEADDELRRRREQLLPRGLDTDHMVLFVGEVDGEPVGWLWYGLPGVPGHSTGAWVYNVVVFEAHRGKGHGRALMLAGEAELVDRGVPEVGLNVFASNTTAVRLYEALGYTVTTQQMTKSLI